MSFISTERTFHGLGTVVAAELPRDIDRLLRKHLEDLFAVRGAGEWKSSRLVLVERYWWVYQNVICLPLEIFSFVALTRILEINKKKNTPHTESKYLLHHKLKGRRQNESTLNTNKKKLSFTSQRFTHVLIPQPTTTNTRIRGAH